MKTCHPELTRARAHNLHRRALLAARRPTGPVGILRAAGETVVLAVISKPGTEFPDPDAGTACWQFRDGRHRIAVLSGLRFAADGLAEVPAGADPVADWKARVKPLYAAFSRAAVRHEVGHARFTCRDNARVVGELKRISAPFRLFNLFEDVRIEAHERKDRGPFRWAKYQAIPTETADPRTWIWAAKSAEVGLAQPRGARWPRWAGPRETATGAAAAITLVALVGMCQGAPSDRDAGLADVVNIVEAFMHHFPDTASAPWPADAGDPGDRIGEERDGCCAPGPGSPPPAPAPAPKPEAPAPAPAPETPAPAPAPETPAPAPAPETPAPRRRVDRPEMADGPKTAGEWAPNPEVDRAWTPERGHDPRIYCPTWDQPPVDADLVRALMARLGRIVHAVADRPAALGEDGRGVYVPAVAGGDPSCWLRPAPTPGRPSLCLVVDMSGSMSGLWWSGGREVVLAFRELARVGRIGLSCWLTGGGYPIRLPVHAPAGVWGALCPCHRVEAFPDTLEQARGDLMAARLAVCFSDGDLTDGAIDVSAWRARGVDLVGTCVAPRGMVPAFASMLGRNFGRAVVNETPMGLASQLAVALSRRR